MRVNYTKIVATLGPNSDSFSTIEDLVQAGMDCARLNFSHGSYKNFKQIVQNVRKAARKHNRTVSLIQDLQGPKIRLGTLPKEGIEVKAGQKIVLSTAAKPPKTAVPVQYKFLHKDVKKDHTIFIDDGLIQIKISKVKGTEIYCTVKTKGTLYSNKGINAPDSQISAGSLTPKDLKDLNFGISLGVDYVALSFVKSAEDLTKLRKIISRKRHQPKIIAKIERLEAIENLEEIVKTADGIMVARGDLGIEIRPEKVPLVQKAIIRLSNKHGKPVITATQVLASMVNNPRPTRAEISDAANAILDNTDAIMLSNETAVGNYPVKAVQTLARVISEVENELKKHREILQPSPPAETNATCLSACELALNTKANHIIVFSRDGYTVREISKHRTLISTIAITPKKELIQELSLLWGINKSFLLKKFDRKKIISLLLKNKAIKKGDLVIVVLDASDQGYVESIKV